MSEGLPELRQRLLTAVEEWRGIRSELARVWSDARATAIDAQHLAPAGEAMAGQSAELTRQEEATLKAQELSRLAVGHAQEADRRRGKAEAALASAREHVAAALGSAAEAVAGAGSARREVDEALRLVGRAGVGCGQAVGVASLRADLTDRVRQGRVNQARRAIAKAAAVEVVWTLAPKAVEAGLEAWSGRLAGVDLGDLADALHQNGPVMAKQVTDALGMFWSKLPRL